MLYRKTQTRQTKSYAAIETRQESLFTSVRERKDFLTHKKAIAAKSFH